MDLTSMTPQNQTIPSDFTPAQDDDSVSTTPEIFENISSEAVLLQDLSGAVNDEFWSVYRHDSAESVKIRDKHFNTLLENFCADYKNRADDKRIMKKWFCGVILAVFLLMLFSVIMLPLILVQYNALNTTTFIASMVTSLAGIISAILTLPQVIAEYLFDPQEDEKFLELIKSMQQYNDHRHAGLDSHNTHNP